MGGGTVLVEASSLGRRSVGIDISGLATFVSKVKTTPLSENDIRGRYDAFWKMTYFDPADSSF